MRAVLLTLTLLLLPAAAHAQRDRWRLDEHMTREGRAERAQSVVERGRRATALRECLRGHPDRCVEAAAIEQAPRRRHALLVRGCNGGYAPACELAGNELANTNRAARGVRWLARACRGGVASACARIASIHREGDGVPRSEVRARLWQARACALAAAYCPPEANAAGPAQ